MRLILLTVFAMLAFAANSVLNRMALVEAGMDPIGYGTIRLIAGALALALIVLVQGRGFALGGARRAWAIAALLIYIFGFSFAYVSLDAGLGALLLFGMVQITMFGAAILGPEALPGRRYIGAGLSFLGLCWLLWPNAETSVSWGHVAAMAAAGAGWGIYSLVGRFEADATQATAMNFLGAAVIAGLFAAVQPDALGLASFTGFGISLAFVSGVVSSGLGYALWYAIMPALGASKAGVAQLTVPVIVSAGGLVFLSEPLTLRFVIATVLVLCGVYYAMQSSSKAA